MISNPKRIDQINIALLFISAAVAWYFPFQLFLLAYAVLGPLHYLTEIFWLEKQGYFLAEKRGKWWLLAAGLLLTMLVLLSQWPRFINLPGMRVWREPVFAGIVFIAFVLALLFTWRISTSMRWLGLVISLFLAAFLARNGVYALLFGMLLATVIHIALFTWFFMLFGALKGRSFWGMVAVVAYVLVVGWLWAGPMPDVLPDWSASVDHILRKSGFAQLNHTMQGWMVDGLGRINLQSETAHRIQALLAFGYTYHYLNWFSKVDIIRWNQVSRGKIYLTLAIWLLAVGLYWFQFQVGLLALFLLSIWHVFLEFPLNARSIRGIFPAARAWWTNLSSPR